MIKGDKTRVWPVLLTAIITIFGLISLTGGLNIDFTGRLRGKVDRFAEWSG